MTFFVAVRSEIYLKYSVYRIHQITSFALLHDLIQIHQVLPDFPTVKSRNLLSHFFPSFLQWSSSDAALKNLHVSFGGFIIRPIFDDVQFCEDVFGTEFVIKGMSVCLVHSSL